MKKKYGWRIFWWLIIGIAAVAYGDHLHITSTQGFILECLGYAELTILFSIVDDLRGKHE